MMLNFNVYGFHLQHNKNNGTTYRHVSLCMGGSLGYKSDVFLKRGTHLDVSWENDPFRFKNHILIY